MRFSHSRRRELIALLGGAATAWPLVARAQQPGGMRRIGVLIGSAGDADDTDVQARLAAFQQGLQQLGWTDGRNVRIEYRRGAGDADRIRRFAAELVAMSYGASLPDLFRRAAGYVQKILTGTKPADLPVEQPTKFELVINLETAKALGVTISEAFLLRTDEVIE